MGRFVCDDRQRARSIPARGPECTKLQSLRTRALPSDRRPIAVNLARPAARYALAKVRFEEDRRQRRSNVLVAVI